MGGSLISQLTDPDRDGVYTGQLMHFSALEYEVRVVQGTGSSTLVTIGGTWPGDPTVSPY